eukprot:356181_1
MAVILTVLAWIYLLTFQSYITAKPFYEKNHNIIQLNSTNYDKTINSMQKGDMYFIEYFSHYCHWCRSFKGQYINFAKFIQTYHNNMNNYNIKLYAIDMANSNDITLSKINNQYNITAYPSILLFIDSYTNYIKYKGKGTPNKYELYNWFKNKLNEVNILIKLHDFPEEYCLNSMAGANYITDSKGWICKINQVNQKTQCCDILSDYDYFSICNSHTKCDSYFPCCLYKINNNFAGEILEYSFYTNDRKQLLNIRDTYFSNFTYCKHECRTSSLSTFEGNVYVDYRKYYCYSKDIIQYENPIILLKQIYNGNHTQFEIIIGNIGESCLNVCERNNKINNVNYKCIQDYKLMSHINSCTSIKQYFENCNGGCMFGYSSYLPGFAVQQSRCYLKATIAKQQNYSCTASNPEYKRLCLCSN